jgi:hypothetical protein
MGSGQWWILRERDRKTVTDAAIRQEERFILTLHRDGRKQIRDGGAGADHVAHPGATVVPGRKITGLTHLHVVTHDTDTLNTVVQPIEGGVLELRKTCRNEPTPPCQQSIELPMESHVQAVRHQMSAAKASCISDQLIECEANRRIVGGNNGTRTRAYDDVDRNVMRDELLQDAEVTGAAQPSAAEHEADPNRRLRVLAWCSTANPVPDGREGSRQPAFGCEQGGHIHNPQRWLL